MHVITNLCAIKRKHLRCVSLHCMTYLTCSSLCICMQITNLCAPKRKHLTCFIALHDISNLFLVTHLHANNYPLCTEKKTSNMRFIALHDISNLFLVMHMHAINNLCAMKRKHLRCVSVHCMTYNLFLVMHLHANN